MTCKTEELFVLIDHVFCLSIYGWDPHQSIHCACQIQLHILVVWNIFIFAYIGNSNPNWRTHIFQRGRYTTNQIVLDGLNMNLHSIPSKHSVKPQALDGWSPDLSVQDNMLILLIESLFFHGLNMLLLSFVIYIYINIHRNMIIEYRYVPSFYRTWLYIEIIRIPYNYMTIYIYIYWYAVTLCIIIYMTIHIFYIYIYWYSKSYL